VPAGMYARQALTKLNLLSALGNEGKIVDGDNVRVALAFVVARRGRSRHRLCTDARIAPGVEVVAEIDPSLHDKIIYPLMLLKAGSRTIPTPGGCSNIFRARQRPRVFEKFGLYLAARR